MAVLVLGAAVLSPFIAAGPAHAVEPCQRWSWRTLWSDSKSSAPYTVTIQFQTKYDATFGDYCGTTFRTVGTATASNTNCRGGKLSVYAYAGYGRSGQVTVPEGGMGPYGAIAQVTALPNIPGASGEWQLTIPANLYGSIPYQCIPH